MKVWDEFLKHFDKENLKNIYENHIKLSTATGIDSMSHKIFEKDLDAHLDVIISKCTAGNYKFTKYKLKLISKGRSKAPREISIPTIRDRLVLRALCDFLKSRFEADIDLPLAQKIIESVKNDISSKHYNTFIKLDVSNYYPSIKHNVMLQRLRKRVKNPEIINLVESSLKTPTVIVSRKDDKDNERGVPQGLSVSNILATIFLAPIDNKYKKNPNIKYYRYVDDVLILCNSKDATNIKDEVIKSFNRIGLKIHCPIKVPEKSTIGSLIADKFSYLGYSFNNSCVSARAGSINKLRESLIAIFSNHKHSKYSSDEFLLWRLNLRVTGCVFQGKRKGWLFFFSEINDEPVLHELDAFIKKQCNRFGVVIKPKLFVRAFYEISHKKHTSCYISNYDNYKTIDMAKMLATYFGFDTTKMKPSQIKYHFNKKISRQIRDLETDIVDFGYPS